MRKEVRYLMDENNNHVPNFDPNEEDVEIWLGVTIRGKEYSNYSVSSKGKIYSHKNLYLLPLTSNSYTNKHVFYLQIMIVNHIILLDTVMVIIQILFRMLLPLVD